MLPDTDNTISRTAENRHNSPQYRDQPDNAPRTRTPPQNQTFAQTRSIEGYGPERNAPPGYWYSAEHDAYYPIPRAPQAEKSIDAVPSQRGYQDQWPVNQQSVTPPPYSSQRQIGYASPPGQYSERAQGASPSFSPGDLAGHAMEFVMNAADGRKRNSGEGFGARFR